MDELSAYRSRIGLFAYTAYKKSSQGKKPKPRQRKPESVTKQTSKRRTTTEVTVEPERRHCTLALMLLLVSVACSIERYGYMSEISDLTSVDWLTGNGYMPEISYLTSVDCLAGNGYMPEISYLTSVDWLTGNGYMPEISCLTSVDWLTGNGYRPEISYLTSVDWLTGNGYMPEISYLTSVDWLTGNGYMSEISYLKSVDWLTGNGYMPEISYLTSVDWLTGNGYMPEISYLTSVDWLTGNGYIPEISYLTSVDWLTGNDTLSSGYGCHYPGNCYYRSTVSSKNLQTVLVIGTTGVITLDSFTSDYKQNHLNSSLMYTNIHSHNYSVLNCRDITSPVSEKPVHSINSGDNHTVVNCRNITLPMSGKPACAINSLPGTCSYLLGNSGCHMYNGQSGDRADNMIDHTAYRYHIGRCFAASVRPNHSNHGPVTTMCRQSKTCINTSRFMFLVITSEEVCILCLEDKHQIPVQSLYQHGLPSLYNHDVQLSSSNGDSKQYFTELRVHLLMYCAGNKQMHLSDTYFSHREFINVTSYTTSVEVMNLCTSLRTCSYLLGNVGMHSSNGNPPKPRRSRTGNPALAVDRRIKNLHFRMVNELSGYLDPSISSCNWTKMTTLLRIYFNPAEIESLKNMIDVTEKLLTKSEIKYGQYENLRDVFSSIGHQICCGIVDRYSQEIEQLPEQSENVYSRDTAVTIQHKMPSVDMELFVKKWKEDDELCYVTTGITHVVQKISSDEVCFHCVVGVPGSGKSTAIRHAALQLKESLGFNIYVITKPEEFIAYLDKGIKQLFVQDDIIGDYFVDKVKLSSWDSYNDRIKSCLDKNTKFLSSLRVQLYLSEEVKGKAYIFSEQAHVTDLTQFKLNRDTMAAMLHHYLQVRHVQNIEHLIRRVEWEEAEQFAGCFPLLCRVFCEDESVRVNPGKYFRDPLPVLQNVFQQIKTNNKPQFCGLLLCGITELKEEYFSTLSELNKLPYFNSIIESLGLDPKKDLLKIKEALKTLDGVYISHIGNRYTFLHSIFQNIVTYLYDDKYYVFKYATRDFITSRVRLFAKLATDDQYMLVYGEECVDLFVSRMIHELKSSGGTYEAAEFIVYNCNIDNETLISRLVTQLYDHHDVSITQRMTDWLFYVSMEVVCDYTPSDVTSCLQYQLLASLITRHDCSRQMEVWWRCPILVSVLYGSLPLTKLLLTKPEVSLDVSDEYNRCVLHVAVKCLSNNVDMTKYLLSLPNLKCLNHRDDDGHTPYWCAVNKPRVKHRQELIKLYKDKGAIL